jgi:hypothetical protein
MKNLLIIFSLLLFPFSSLAQESDLANDLTPIQERKSEVKLGVVQLLAITRINLEYERILDSYSSFGGNIVFDTEKEEDLNFRFNGFYRMYFSSSEEYGQKGFFIQGLVNYSNGSDYEYSTTFDQFGNYITEGKKTNYNAINAGFGLGKKWINKKGFVLQGVISFGRKLTGSENAPEYVIPAALSLGYRF